MKTLTVTARPALTSGAISAQAWHDLMLMLARVLGRTNAGQQDEAADLDGFYVHPVMAAVAPGWMRLADTLRQVFERRRPGSIGWRSDIERRVPEPPAPTAPVALK